MLNVNSNHLYLSTFSHPEWFVNNKPLQVGAKFKTVHDFGYVALDIVGAYAEDSGIYTVKATNSKGSATTSGTLKCLGKF